MNPRRLVIKTLLAVITNQRSLTEALSQIDKNKAGEQYAWIQAASYGVIRYYHQLIWLEKQLIKKPLKPKDQDIRLLLLLGLYEILYMNTPDHAVVSEIVHSAEKYFKKRWAKGLLNACLRGFLRERKTLLDKLKNDEAAFYAHPSWLLKKLQKQYPDQWQMLLEVNNQQGPLTLRVNQQKILRDAFIQQAKEKFPDITFYKTEHSPQGVRLSNAMNIESLPGFSEGWFSVQDEAAQLAALMLAPKPHEKMLDACAAPGGKACHLLETESTIQLTALDIDAQRLEKVQDNLNRLGLTANVQCADAAKLDSHEEYFFDAILLDAPCSGTGVIRRHPDIKLLRKPNDIENLQKQQAKLLASLWLRLKPGGRLLYATCSLLKEENQETMQTFLAKTTDATISAITQLKPSNDSVGLQILPGQDNMDGFYYCLLFKSRL